MILVLGGYGGFGARICRRLAAAGERVLVAGRDRAKAEAFCIGVSNLVPLPLDRDTELIEALATHRPFALVDAAGPFQGLGYDVPKACLAAGCHYLDIADGRAFVAGIGVLDTAAKAANLCLIAGASSVPALSGAVIRSLAAGLERVQAVEMAISASNKATAGPSVTRAILSYVGKPTRLWRGGRWIPAFGWGEPRHEVFALSGEPGLASRVVALADVPDLDLVPDRLPGRPAVTFRAGTELPIETMTLWMLSWLVRWGLIRGLEPIGPLMIRAKALTAALGTDRSGMIVRLFGWRSGVAVERRWTLVARDGDGPEIPALAVPILVAKLRRRDLDPGASDAGLALALEDFEPAFAALSIRHATVETARGPSLYERVMGAGFAALPPAVRALHDVHRDAGAFGAAVVSRGTDFWARTVCAVMRFPRAGSHSLHVGFTERDGVETWTRDFGGARFASRMSRRGDHLVERFGPLRFAFRLVVETGVEASGPRLAMVFARWWIGPLSMPRVLAPVVTAHEWEEEGRFQFDVRVGGIVRYRGWLSPREG